MGRLVLAFRRGWEATNRFALPEMASLLGGGVFLARLWQSALTRESVLDEGAYLLKGYLFATGQYTPFQDGGPWTNQMPLAFLIPGYVERLFGPGLRSGRFFAILLAMLMLLGVWVLARRLGNRGWAAAAVWALAWNPTWAKMYSLAVSQVLVACLLVWTLVLVLGKGRPLWQVTLGAALAGAMILTRINMAPLLSLVCLYAFWQHGKKAGLAAILAGGLVVVIGHALVWPEVLQMWAPWLPRSLTHFLEVWRLPSGYTRLWDPQYSLESRLLSFFLALRFHLAPILGALVAMLLWPRRKDWRSQDDFRAAVFLAVFFWGMYAAHLWITLGGEYCVFCLESYLAFFSMTGLLLLIVSFPSWRKILPWWRQVALAALVIGLIAGVGYGAYDEIAPALLGLRLPTWLHNLPQLAGKNVTLSKYLGIRFEIDGADQKRLVAILAGALAGALVLALALLARVAYSRWRKVRPTWPPLSFGYLALVLLLLASVLLAPLSFLGGGRTAYDCDSETISTYEAAGLDLASKLPAGAWVYWRGGKSIAPLLYVPGIHIYPQQMEGNYAYYLGGDPELLLRFGLMNETLDRQWLNQADYVLVENRLFDSWIRRAEILGEFEELQSTPPTVSCYPGSQIHIFKRTTP